MFSVLLPDGDDIDGWASQIRAQDQLPHLVRRLIARTTQPSWIDVPAGSAIRFAGWDGELEVPQGNTWVPQGRSFWEMGTDGRVTNKAQDDYLKRTNSTPESIRETCSYVFVTPHHWSWRKNWIAQKKKLGQWADVRAVDANGLATWAESVPYIHLWLSHLINAKIHGAQPLDHWWTKWSEKSDPHPLAPDVLLRGRADEIDLVLRWISGSPRRLIVEATSVDAAIAFVAALLKTTSGALDQDLMRSVVVSNADVWDEIVLVETPMILIATFEDVWVRGGTKNGHHVLLPAAIEDPGESADLRLADLARDDLIAGLEQMGLDPKAALLIVDESAAELTTVRRRLSSVDEFRAPSWSLPDVAGQIAPALLAGSWDASVEGDREALARLANRPYEVLEKDLTVSSEEDDAPLRRKGSVWLLANRRDAWRLVAGAMSSELLDRFVIVAQDVLGAPDPAQELLPDERWMAAVKGKARPHSDRLRRGLATSIAMLAGWRHLSELPGGRSGPATAQEITGPLMHEINSNDEGGGWIGINGELPLLAEADPNAYLDAVSAGLDGADPILARLLRESEEGGIFGRAHHSAILWGLESLAWSAAYLSRVASVLARWAALDSGGRWGNRPGASFTTIFLPWHPGTSASVAERIATLEEVAEEQGAWPLLVTLLPKRQAFSGVSHRPSWRTWAPAGDVAVTNRDRAEVESAAFRLLLETIDDRADGWIDLVDAYENLPPQLRDELVARLAQLDPVRIEDADRERLWDKLRITIGHHRAHPDAVWALREEHLAPLDRLVDRFAPADPVIRVKWLFASHPDSSLISGADYRSYDEALAKRRTEAITGVLTLGWDSVENLVELAQDPVAAGFALGELENVAAGSVLGWADAKPSQQKALFGFFAGRTNRTGWDWAATEIRSHVDAWSAAQLADVIQAASRRTEGWELAQALGQRVEKEYWSDFRGFWTGEDAWIAVGKLLEFGHPFEALDLISAQLHGDGAFDSGLARDALFAASEVDPQSSHIVSSLQHFLPELLDRLESGGISENDVASIEWKYLRLLEHSERPATRLGRHLASNPDFFVEIVSLVYRGASETAREVDDGTRAIAEQGWHLLSMWQTPPGLTDKGIDESALRDWTNEARRQLAEADRAEIGDLEIGKILWWAPAGSDGHRPHEAVRNLIEALQSPALDRGFANEAFNSRGVTMRAPGGEQEREIARGYRVIAHALRGGWPRTAAIFDSLAKSYIADAERWDIDAAIRELDDAEDA
jgi:hypothetical protein